MDRSFQHLKVLTDLKDAFLTDGRLSEKIKTISLLLLDDIEKDLKRQRGSVGGEGGTE